MKEQASQAFPYHSRIRVEVVICWGVICPGAVFAFDPVIFPLQNRRPHPEDSRWRRHHREPLVSNVRHDSVVRVDNVHLIRFKLIKFVLLGLRVTSILRIRVIYSLTYSIYLSSKEKGQQKNCGISYDVFFL